MPSSLLGIIASANDGGDGPPPDPLTTDVTFTYVSNGDANGVFHYYGTGFSAVAFDHPCKYGIGVSASGMNTGSQTADKAFDENDATSAFTANSAGSWFTIDFGIDRVFTLSDFTMRSPAEYAYMNNWLLEASNDNSSWSTIYTASSPFSAISQWGHFTASSGSAYRYWKFRSTGTDSAATNFMGMSAVEFYGVLTSENAYANETVGTDLSTITGDDIVKYFATINNSVAWKNPELRGKVEIDLTSSGTFTALDKSWKMFDNSGSTSFTTNPVSTAPPNHIIDFGPNQEIWPTAYGFSSNAGSGGYNKTWALYGSNDGSSWTTLDSRTGDRAVYGLNASAATLQRWGCSQTGVGYRYLKLTVTDTWWDNYSVVNQLSIWGGINSLATPDYSPGTVLEQDTSGIMGAHTPTITASSIGGGSTANLKDQNKTTDFYTGNSANSWIEFDWGANTVRPDGVSLHNRWAYSGDQAPQSIAIQGWNGSSWDTIRQITIHKVGSGTQHKWGNQGDANGDSMQAWFWCYTEIAYSKLRLLQNGRNTSNYDYFILSEVEWYGDYT